MIQFHICKSFKSKSNNEIDTLVSKFIKTNKNRSSIHGIGRVNSFNGGIYIFNFKKPYIGNIVIQEQHIDYGGEVYTVYFLRTFFKENLQEFVEVRNGKWINYNPLEKSEIESFKNTLRREQKKQIILPSPPKELIDWQKDYELKVDYDIYETEDWVRFAISDSFESGMKTDEVKVFRIALQDIVKGKYENKEVLFNGENYQTISSVFKNEIGIIFNRVKLQNKLVFQLINGANVRSQKAYWEEIKKANYDFKDKLRTIIDISRLSVKAYPNWALNDSELWARVQKNNQYGNLSLLPEQTNFLKDFKFPKYINGQAGSGKSTMLYYLFSNIYYYKYIGEIKEDIIFLTENEKLLEHTYKSVVDLLYNNPQFDISSEPEAITDVEKHFYPFKEFLLSFLPDDCLEFDGNKYLNFSKFKLLYEQSNIQEHIKIQFSPELVWFTITTYVKGNSLDYDITSENYDEKMPTKGKDLISKEDLKKMERYFIKPLYNRLLSEGYWDKIKLIKYLSKNIKISKSYGVIFCDEAQDFSKVELRFIIKLSAYNNYDLSNVEQFPMVFAGDAHQTVNPTGFRSEVLTSMIYNELTKKENNYNLDSSNLEFTPEFNYRSSQTIVNLSNAVQYHRKKELNADIKKPQISKRPLFNLYEHLNIFISFKKFNNNLPLQDKISLKTIIVPVNDEEIDKFIKDNPILEKFNNIISAVNVKGLDFNEVALYGFGKYYEDIEMGIYEKRFFFNKLYVAVTRAQAELLIIDSICSKDTFWKEIVENYLTSQWCQQITPGLKSFEDFVISNVDEVISSKANTVENDAERQMSHGIIEKNIPLLSIAANHFLKLKKQKQYFLCLGAIEEIRERWAKSAQYYSNKATREEGLEKALGVLWKGRLFQEYIDYNKKFDINEKTVEDQVKLITAKLFVEEELSYSDLKNLSEKTTALRRVINKVEWGNDIIETLAHYMEQISDKEDIITICDLLEEICDDKNVVLERVSHQYYLLGKHQAAISLLDKISKENQTYYKSKLAIAKKRGNIEEIIIYSGKLLVTSKKPKEYVNTILDNYPFYENEKGEEIRNIYFHLYGYLANLYNEVHFEKILKISKRVEESFEVTKRIDALVDGYKFLLYNKSDGSLFNFCLERWVKNLKKLDFKIEDINLEYEKLINQTKNNCLKYIPFTDEEIDTIPSIPNMLKKPVPQHLKNLTISNFRKFNKIEINNLGLINLVVGDNNIGKTTFLESLLFSADKNTYIKRLAYAYINRVNINPEKEKTSKGTNHYFTLSKEFLEDYINYDTKDKKIKYSITERRESWNYNFSFGFEDQKDSMITEYEYHNYDFLDKLKYADIVSIPYMPFGKGYDTELAVLYDTQIRPYPKLSNRFINNLKTFIPKIKQVFVNSEGGIDIRDEEHSFDISISQYGEGVNKLFRILLLLTIHKGKMLLIDEIDAGIHYSRFHDFWRILLNIAKDDNTQLIVTTHNEECIKYFNDVLNEVKFGKPFQEISRVIQMKKVKGLKIRSFEFESFNLAIEDSFEIR